MWFTRKISLSLLGLGLLTVSAELFSEDTSCGSYRSTSIAANLTSRVFTLGNLAAAKLQCLDVYRGLPLAFEINQGQTDRQIDFLSRSNGRTLFLTPTEATLTLASEVHPEQARLPILGPFVSPGSPAIKAGSEYAALRMKLVDANPQAARKSFEELPGKANYFIGKDPTEWRSGITTYARVGYQDVYPGVDLIYYGNHGQLEFDFIVAPNARPEVIKIGLEGAEKIEINSLGDLVVQIADVPVLRMRKPLIYQQIDGDRREISGGYVLEDHQVSLQIGRYDVGKPLVIDPVFAYSTRLGGDNNNAGYAIAVDAVGNAYVTGETQTDFARAKPIHGVGGGSTDVFVAKLSADGSKLLYITYLGGSSADVGYGIAIDSAGNAYITGDTRSADFPLVNPVQAKLGGAADIFVAKLSTDGSKLLYSTYIGGSGGERGLGIAVDAFGNAYVTGYTNSLDFPIANALQPAFAGGNADAFVLKLDPSGSKLIYSTYLGGGNDRPDIGTAIAADAVGNAYVTGFTNSADFPTKNPLQRFVGPTDVFVTKLNPAGAPVYSTHLGGSADDEAMGIAVDTTGSAYVTGHTESPDFPTTAGAFSPKCVSIDAKLPIGNICLGGDAFVSKISPDGSALVYSTFLSGRGFEVGRGIAVDAAGRAHVTGFTTSPDFPTMNPLQEKFGGGHYDAFLVKLNLDGSALIYSTFLGGSGDDGGYGLAVDITGNVYVIGITSSPDFPARNSLLDLSHRASREPSDAFVVKISDDAVTNPK
jgi:beta-propeller repeat-containing protein